MSESEVAKKLIEILRAKGHDVKYVAIEPEPKLYDAEGRVVTEELPKEESLKTAYCEVSEGRARCGIGPEPELQEVEVSLEGQGEEGKSAIVMPLPEETEVGHEEGGAGEGAEAEAEAD